MNAAKTIIAALALLALVGCSTSPVRPQDATPVPASRVFMHTTATPNDGAAIVVRDSGFTGSGCGVNVFLDGTKVAELASGEKVKFPVSAGDHIFGAAPSGKGLCGLGDAEHAQRRDVKASIEAGHTITFRVGISGGGTPVFYQSSL